MDLVQVSTPITREQKLAVVTLDDAKESIKLRNTSQDKFIERAIVASYNILSGPNGYIGGAPILFEQWDLFLDSAAGEVEIPIRPLFSLDSFSYMDANSAYQTVGASYYRTYGREGFTWIKQLPVGGYPTVGVAGDPRGFRIRATAGFAATDAPEDVPDEIKLALLMLVGHFYENREQTIMDNRINSVSREVQWGVRQILGPHFVHRDHS